VGILPLLASNFPAVGALELLDLVLESLLLLTRHAVVRCLRSLFRVFRIVIGFPFPGDDCEPG